MSESTRESDHSPIATVGIVGAGFMGGQLALHVAAAGYPVTVVDPLPEALTRMRRGHEDELDRRVTAGSLSIAVRTGGRPDTADRAKGKHGVYVQPGLAGDRARNAAPGR